MRKLLFLLAVIGSMTALGADILPLYVNFSDKSFGTFQPSGNDRQFEFNSESGMYETIIDYDIKQNDKFIRFYQKDGEEILPWNAYVWTRLSMLSNKEYEISIAEGNTSPLQLMEFYGEVTSASVKISVNTNESVLYLKQIVEKEFVPEHIYIWGSDNGGFSTRIFATMEPSPEDPYFFSTDMEMPTWYFDPKGVMADFASNAFVFYLCTSKELKSGTKFRANLPYETEDLSFSNIALGAGETFTTTLQTEIQESCDLVCHTPGRMHLTFNYSNLEFTAKMLDPMNHVSLMFDGIDTYVHNKYIDVYCNGNEVPLFVNPQSLWYNEPEFNLSIIPKPGYEVTMECLSDGLPFEMTEKEGIYEVKSSENGLLFLVNINKKDEDNEDPDKSGIMDINDSSIVTVYNLQGIAVATGNCREIILKLPKGLYIISGRLYRIS